MKRHNNTIYSTLSSTMILHAFEGTDDGAGGAGSGDQNPPTKSIADQIAEAVATATAALKAKNDQLLAQERQLKDKVKTFDGVDLEKIRVMQEQIDADEDLKLIQAGKKHEVIAKHTERMRAAHEEAIQAEREKTAAEAKRAETYRGAVLDSQILAVTQGLHKGAVEDALLHARHIFTLDADGKAVQMSGERPVLGKDGVTPFSPAEWIETQKELKPHWFPASTTGSGSVHTRDAGGTGKTIKRVDFDRLGGPEKATVVKAGTKIVD